MLVDANDRNNHCDSNYQDNNYIQHAFGLPFPIPDVKHIPNSLKNIIVNMIKYGHIKQLLTLIETSDPTTKKQLCSFILEQLKYEHIKQLKYVHIKQLLTLIEILDLTTQERIILSDALTIILEIYTLVNCENS